MHPKKSGDKYRGASNNKGEEPEAEDTAIESFLMHKSPGLSQNSKVVIRLLNRAVRKGNICLDLTTSDVLSEITTSAEECINSLRKSNVIGSAEEARPLTLNGNRLYFRRHYLLEQKLSQNILLRMGRNRRFSLWGRASEILERLFPDDVEDLNMAKEGKIQNISNPQLKFCLMLLKFDFLVLTGGPGTGKTTTAVKAMATSLFLNPNLRIEAAAPTGKAALRLAQSLQHIRTELSLEDSLRDALPHEAKTLHRLLGFVPGRKARYNKERLLPCDLLLIDEASMADLDILARTVEALPEQAALILIGDSNQLASVEAGAALGDLCTAFESAKNKMPHLLRLEKNFRFSSAPGVGAFSKSVVQGKAREAIRILRSDDKPDIRRLDDAADPAAAFLVEIREGYRLFCEATTGIEALHCLDSFRILSPVRRGLRGTEALNRLCIQTLYFEKQMNCLEGMNLPILICRNDYHLGLYNGDTGVLITDRLNGRRAYFRSLNGDEIREFPVETLPPHEVCFAMTVHKSQGSEFDRILLVLPENESAVLSRELLYTAATRCRTGLELLGSERILQYSIAQKTLRTSGLTDILISAIESKKIVTK